jgi:hypothetical protein
MWIFKNATQREKRERKGKRKLLNEPQQAKLTLMYGEDQDTAASNCVHA